MHVSDLSGSLLDAWVAKAAGKAPGPAYSSSWADAGPLIEKHHIHIAPMAGKGYVWCATVVDEAGRGAWKEGRTPLVSGRSHARPGGVAVWGRGAGLM